MKTSETKRMEMCIHVYESRQEFALAMAEGSRGAELYVELGLAVEQIRGSAYEQSRAQSSVREISATVAETREELEKLLDAIRRTARSTGITGLEDKFLPSRKVPDQGLLTLASTYANDAFHIKAQLIKRGLGPDFINDLAVASQAFDAALNERSLRLGKQVAATADLELKIERAMRIVRELGVVIENVYAADPAKLAHWESVSHVEKTPRRAPKEEDDGGESTPPAQD
jgi:hypothetical protein